MSLSEGDKPIPLFKRPRVDPVHWHRDPETFLATRPFSDLLPPTRPGAGASRSRLQAQPEGFLRNGHKPDGGGCKPRIRTWGIGAAFPSSGSNQLCWRRQTQKPDDSLFMRAWRFGAYEGAVRSKSRRPTSGLPNQQPRGTVARGKCSRTSVGQ